MNIHIIQPTDSLWLPVAEYAGTCSWGAGERMAAAMKESGFNDCERLFVAEENGDFMGFCALTNPQNFPVIAEYNPWIRWVFVDEKYRGRRLSQKLLEAVADYAKTLGYDKVFLSTWHIGLYEKYGFVKICEKEMREGYYEGIYEKKI